MASPPNRPPLLDYFYDSELLAAGILELSCAKPSDLDNCIHPIFRHENFRQLCLVTYETLTPALRFASLLITEAHCLEWWVSILFGRRVPVSNLPKKRSVILPVDPITTDHFFAAEEHLLGLESRITFRFTVQDEAQYAYGMQFRSASGRDRQVIEFSDRFRDFVESGGFANSSVSHQLRFLFFFALNMVHELAHAVFDTRADSTLSREPYVAHDVQKGLFFMEMGDSWERFIFGCKIQPLSGEVGYSEDCRFGLHRFSPSARYEDSTFGAVPMGYVSALMSKSRWEAVRKKGVRMLRCPEARIHAFDILVKCGKLHGRSPVGAHLGYPACVGGQSPRLPGVTTGYPVPGVTAGYPALEGDPTSKVPSTGSLGRENKRKKIRSATWRAPSLAPSPARSLAPLSPPHPSTTTTTTTTATATTHGPQPSHNPSRRPQGYFYPPSKFPLRSQTENKGLIVVLKRTPTHFFMPTPGDGDLNFTNLLAAGCPTLGAEDPDFKNFLGAGCSAPSAEDLYFMNLLEIGCPALSAEDLYFIIHLAAGYPLSTEDLIISGNYVGEGTHIDWMDIDPDNIGVEILIDWMDVDSAGVAGVEDCIGGEALWVFSRISYRVFWAMVEKIGSDYLKEIEGGEQLEDGTRIAEKKTPYGGPDSCPKPRGHRQPPQSGGRHPHPPSNKHEQPRYDYQRPSRGKKNNGGNHHRSAGGGSGGKGRHFDGNNHHHQPGGNNHHHQPGSDNHRGRSWRHFQ
ncbi:hypothetical protein FGG08_007421 [Glutinoglossum americanum]|uniref:Uncharacterized protein n=1 Tax=Glutinoglossum americanum TaxID=1670608 RepID=A0A9P8KTY2_9PEZI|nr:hypothetical protein FGG08_007421 [Glutinoglossum americanum]